MNDLAQAAISLALQGNWKEAIKLNKQLLEENSKDVDAINRLARAYAELGKMDKAKTFSKKALKIDPFNRIAAKNLTKWKGANGTTFFSPKITSPNEFLEEPGKTRIAPLMYLGDSKLVATLDCGDEVMLTAGSHRVSITTSEGKYIGRLPDDLSAKLRGLISLGNKYKVIIKSADINNLKVFIREIQRAPKLADIPSFPPEKIDYISFTPPELVHKNDVIKETAEE